MGPCVLLFAASLIGSAIARPALASTGSIAGRVVDDVSGAPVEGARVALEPGRRIGTTDADGSFAFTDLSPGSYRIEVSHVAYLASRERSATVEPGGTARVELRLERNPVRETVVVRSQPPPPRDETGPAQISGDEMAGIPGSLGDPVRGLATLPGVASINDLKGDLRIHGGEPEDTLFRMDGVTVANPYHFRFTRASISGLNPGALDAFAVRTSSLAPSVGDTVSGVVDLAPSDRGSQGGFLDAAVGTLTASATGGGPLAEGSWIAAGRYSSLALYRNLYDVKNLSVPMFRDLLLRARTPIAPRMDIVAGGLYLGSDLSASDRDDNSSTELDAVSEVAYVGVDAGLAGRLRLTGRLVWERAEQTVWSSDGDDLTARTRRRGISLDLMEGDDARPTWRLGLDQSWLDGTYVGAIQSAGLIRPLDVRTARAGAHGSVTFAPAPRWSVDAGARVDRDSRHGLGPIQPRARATYAAAAGWKAWLAADRYAQFPRFEQEFLAQGTPLEIATADEVSAGAAFDLYPGIGASLTIFARRLEGITAETVNRLPDLPEPVGRFERGQSRGLDLAVRKDRGRLRSRLAVTFLRARETRDGHESPGNGDQPCRVDLFVAWLLTPRWDLSGRFQSASGLPLSSFVPIGGGDMALGGLNGDRLPDYARLDIRTSWDFACWKGRGRFYLEIANVLNRVNVRGRDLRYDPAEDRYYFHDEASMPRVPSFGLEISWGE